MKKLLILLTAATIAFNSCDVIEDPIIPVTTNYREDLYGPAPEFGPATDNSQNVMIEDFTAHQCGNCPDAAVIADAILEEHPEEIVVIAVHAGNLAVTNDEAPFDANWVTPEGEVYWDQLDFQANPLGRINRNGGPGNFYAPTVWEDQVSNYLGSTADLSLQIITDYVSENNHLNVHVNGQFETNYPNSTHLVVLFTESELYDYQLWYGNDPEVVPNYHFKHTLRGSVTGPNGLSFTTASASSGETYQKDYTFEWNQDWILENCEVVAFVYDDVTGEVINVMKAHL